MSTTTNSETTSETATQKPARTLPPGVEHIGGNRYRIKLSALVLTEGGFNSESTELVFTNVRHALSDYKLLGQGFSKDEMEQLRDSIQQTGLRYHPICRWLASDGKPVVNSPDTAYDRVQVVNGERRVYALRQLIKSKAMCFDPISGQMVPAAELYGTIEVAIEEMDNIKAYEVAYGVNEQAKNIGSGCEIAFVRYLRHCLGDSGDADATICKITNRDPQWLAQTDKLCALDDKTFVSLCNNEITRQIALDLYTNYADEGERQKVLFELKGKAQARHAAKVEKASKLAAKAETKAAVAEQEAEGAEEMAAAAEELAQEGVIAPEDAKQQQNDAASKKVKAKEAKDKSQAKKTKAQQIASKKPKVTSKDMKGGDPKPLTATKIEKNWWQTLQKLVKSEGKDDDGNDLGYDLWDARLAKLMCEQIKKGNPDILRVLRFHLKKKNDAKAAGKKR